MLLAKALIVFMIVQNLDSGTPTLNPEKFIFACPNQLVKFTCYSSEVEALVWVAEPYIPANDPIIYVSELIGSGYSYPAEYRSPFIANLTGLTRSNNELQLANLTSELTFLANTVDNETSIRCETYAGDQPSTSSSTFFKAVVPEWKTPSVFYQENETGITVVLELADMFDGGRVPIDYYMVQIDNGTQFKTSDPMYSFDISYNTTVSLKIAAYNCAGKSNISILQVEFKKVEILFGNTTPTSVPESTFTLPLSQVPTLLSTPTKRANISTDISMLYMVVVSVTCVTGALILTVIVVLAVLCIYKCCTRCKDIISKQNVCSPSSDIGSEPIYDTPTWDSRVGPNFMLDADYVMEKNPLYMMKARHL